MTTTNANIVNALAKKLGIEDVFQGAREKGKCIEQLMEKYGLESKNICFVGDDINDIPAFEIVGLPIAVQNANYKVKKLKNIFVTKHSGGNGALRELADLILAESE